jgi:prepilin signal peptidase PulO-like enzyme (type II secretory pathway)
MITLTVAHVFGFVMVFVFGATVGSFLNVCIVRIPNNESVIHPPSRRPKCKAMIVAASTPLWCF